MFFGQLVLLFFPAGLANLLPVMVKKINFLALPINSFLFGGHKTWRGMFFGILGGTLIGRLWYEVLVVKPDVNLLFFCFLLSSGALFGDLFKSFFKRRLQIKEGQSWVPFDQLDYILGSIFLGSFFISLSFKDILGLLFVFSLLHPLFNILGYFLRIKENKF